MVVNDVTMDPTMMLFRITPMRDQMIVTMRPKIDLGIRSPYLLEESLKIIFWIEVSCLYQIWDQSTKILQLTINHLTPLSS